MENCTSKLVTLRSKRELFRYHLEQQNHPQYSMNDSKRKKLMNVLEDLVQLRKKLDNK